MPVAHPCPWRRRRMMLFQPDPNAKPAPPLAAAPPMREEDLKEPEEEMPPEPPLAAAATGDAPGGADTVGRSKE
eukprot:668757-Prymnesium_polylepis.1